ncbi:DUF3053 family protein [Thorsellia kenyensis]|uniref:DUF3053 family protein n=1 Tax=Thorsellia kenyensis TaxID=1549888 RepID=A0ABV6CCD1_9GAMM
MKINGHVKRVLLVTTLLSTLFYISACSDPEVKQRAEFKNYVENTVLRVGYELPELSEDQKEKFGEYSQDYEAIFNFTKRFNEITERSFNPLMEHLSQIKVTEDYIALQPILSEDLTKIFFLKSDIESLKSDTLSKLSKKSFPEDLNAVMTPAIEKLITLRADPLLENIDGLVTLTKNVNQLGLFLNENKANITYVQGIPNFKSKELAESYNAMINKIAEDIKYHEATIALYNAFNEK